MQNQDLNSNKGINSFCKTPKRNFMSITPSPLYKEDDHHMSTNSGNHDAICSFFPLKQKCVILIEPKSEDSHSNEDPVDFDSNLDNSPKASNKSSLSIGRNKTENKEKKFIEASSNYKHSENLKYKFNNLKLNTNSKNKNSNFKSAYNTTTNSYSADLIPTKNDDIIRSYDNSKNYLIKDNKEKDIEEDKEKDKEKEKEIVEAASPLTSHLKNFLENYDDLLGMIGSNSKSSTMTSNVSNENNNNNYFIYTNSVLDQNVSNFKQDPKSKTLNLLQGNSYPSTFPDYMNEEGSKNAKKFVFSSSFKTKKSVETSGSHAKNAKSTLDCFETGSLSLKKTVSDMPVTQSKLRRKFLENSLFKPNPAQPIIEEDKGSNAFRRNSKEKKKFKKSEKEKTGVAFKIIPKTNSDEENEIENENDNLIEVEDDSYINDDCDVSGETKKDLSSESQPKEYRDIDKDSCIMLNPINVNIPISATTLKKNNLHRKIFSNDFFV